MTASGSNGYLDDIPYLRAFFPYLTPAWLDHVALISGYAPPERDDGFAYCDLGCGQGVTAGMLAAMHPRGTFCGIDISPTHIDHARRLAADAQISNASFHCADFAAELALPMFDYIVAHGVYTWVSTEAQEALRRFVDRQLKPGGLVFLSYNALPGWAADLPFQHLLHALGAAVSGDSVARYRGAIKIVGNLLAAGVPALKASPILKELTERPDSFPEAYLAHEFMVAAWRPLWFTEVRAAMAAIGLEPAGSAALIDNYDTFVLGEAARQTLEAIADDTTRELVREFFVSQRFRRDVYIRKSTAVDEDEQRRRLMGGTFALTRPAALIEYAVSSPAGRVSFDNAAARKVVDELAHRPRRLADIAHGSAIGSQDLLANMLMLCAAGAARPVEAVSSPVATLNRAILSRLDGAEPIEDFALGCGTALRLDWALLDQIRSGRGIDPVQFVGWTEFLADYGC